jgi:4-amino-4-deoxychorismate lyase
MDRGFMFGHGAFETFRVSGDNIFLLEEHFTRLDKNLKALGIDWGYEPSKHLVWVKEISGKIPKGKDGRIRFCVTSGDGSTPNVIIYLSYIDKFKPAEKKAKILKSLARHKPEYFDVTGFRIKSLEYSHLYIARKELEDDSTEGILLNPDGWVAEALTSNIFWVKDSKIYTPPLSLGILAGTMRGWLTEKFNVEEKLIKQEELLQADEIFLSAGASYLVAISSVGEVKKPGIKGQAYGEVCTTLTEHLTKTHAL